MLSPNRHGTELLGECSRHESGVVKEGPDVTLIASVKDDGAVSAIVVGGIDQVSHLIGRSSSTVVIEVINCG